MLDGLTVAGAVPTFREWLLEAPFALSLSAGFFGFFAHAGFMAALEDEGLVPDSLSGSSAGALIAGLWAAGLDAVRVRDELAGLRREHFWDPGLGLGLLRGGRFRGLLEAALPVAQFEQSRRLLAISAYDCWARRTVVLQSGSLATAIHASCAYPLLFQPLWLDGRPLLDGGIADRPGWAGLKARERVLLHHLPSRSRPGIGVPRRSGARVVCVENLPRVGPFRLKTGMSAFDHARRAITRALGQPVADVIQVAGG